jgi:hypothetical protein
VLLCDFFILIKFATPLIVLQSGGYHIDYYGNFNKSLTINDADESGETGVKEDG